MKQDLILSIEAAVAGGSLSILGNRDEIDGWIGSGKISKAEDILEQISNLLKKNKLKKEDIKAVAVSIEAGSLTGEKIGRAIAKGLAKSLNCRLFKIPVLESLLFEFGSELEGKYLTAIPLGKNCVQWQTFTIKDGVRCKSHSCPQISGREEFIKQIKKLGCDNVMLAANFSESYNEGVFRAAEPIAISLHSLAKIIGQTIDGRV